ncbi:MAG: oxidoreductase [Acidimicrobiales bacterium]
MTVDRSRINALPRQDGRVVMVTGANTGLGYHNAQDLAAKGATVVLACRNEARARAAMDRIAAQVPGADLHFLAIDLSSLDAVRAAAAAFRQRHDRLDVLINNAGIMAVPYQRSVDGFESQMAANYWGHFLLTMLLMDLLPDSAGSRIVTLSSVAHRGGLKRIRFEDIHWTAGYATRHAYSQTKLACLIFALELDRRLQSAGRQTLSVAAHPGVSETELMRSMPSWQRAIVRRTVAPLLFHAPPAASRPTLVAALSPDARGGDYYGPQGFLEWRGDPGPANVLDGARDPSQASRLWELSVALTGADLPFPAPD